MKNLKVKLIILSLFSLLTVCAVSESIDTETNSNIAKSTVSPNKAPTHRLDTSEKKWLDGHKDLRIIIIGHSAPIEFTDVDGKFRGMAVDYLKFLANKLNFTFRFVKATSMSLALDLIKDKKADAILSITPTPERFEFMDFSSPYLEANPVIIVSKREKDNFALDNLNKHRVAIEKGTATEEFIKFNYPNIDLVAVPSPYAGLTLVSTGGATAFISNMLEASYYIESEGIINLKVAGKTDYVTRFTFGVRKDYSIFVSILNKGIASTTESERKKIFSQWTSFQSPHVYTEEFWIIVLIISGAMFGVFILIIVWNLSLKRQVISRTKELVSELAERQKAEKEITKYRDHLEDLVKERTATLNKTNVKLTEEINERKKAEIALSEAKEVAEEANKAKSLFLANMSHEIRTPMNVILGFSQLLCRDNSISGEQREHLETIDRSGKHLLKLIDQILEMTKIEAGKLTLNEEVFDLKQMLRDLEIMFNTRAIDSRIDFTIKAEQCIPKYLVGDSGKIRQVLVNLLGNAIKYTDEGHVILCIQALSDDDKEARLKFSVEDTGQGISEDEEHKLFSSFSQTRSGIKGGKGTGLGLAISQKYIMLMGSEIKYRRVTEQGGSDFYFELELEKGHVTESDIANFGSPEQALMLKDKYKGKYRILICEDEEENRILLSRLLTDVGFIVETADNGKQGLQVLKEFNPDLVLLDLRMPVMDGYQTIAKIREMNKFKHIPVFAVTANVFHEDRKKVSIAGFNEFFPKPIDDNKLLLLIKKYLNVDFLYSEKKVEHMIKTSSESGICCSVLSDILRQQLISAIEAADYDDILTKLDEVKSKDQKLYDKLYELADSFEYSKMLELLK